MDEPAVHKIALLHRQAEMRCCYCYYNYRTHRKIPHGRGAAAAAACAFQLQCKPELGFRMWVSGDPSRPLALDGSKENHHASKPSVAGVGAEGSCCRFMLRLCCQIRFGMLRIGRGKLGQSHCECALWGLCALDVLIDRTQRRVLHDAHPAPCRGRPALINLENQIPKSDPVCVHLESSPGFNLHLWLQQPACCQRCRFSTMPPKQRNAGRRSCSIH